MPLTNNQATLYAALGTSAENLDDKLSAYIAAQAAVTSAAAGAASAKNDLDAAWVDFVSRDGSFDGAMLVAPSGYTPPTP